MTVGPDPDVSSVIRALSFALQVGDSGVWDSLSGVLRMRLTARQRASLAWAALRSLDKEQAQVIAESVDSFPAGAGTPMNPTGDPLDEAKTWIRSASADEIDAYAVAAFHAMSDERKAEFLTYAQKVSAA